MLDASTRRLRRYGTGPNDRPREDSTRHFYETRATEYAEVTRDRPLESDLKRFSARIPHGIVLDLGCGAGYDLDAFRSRGHPAFGLDYAEPLAGIARARSLCPVIVADMRAVPFRSGVFDGVWASASLLHLPRHDLPIALGEIRRVLKPGGLLFASVKAGDGSRRGEDGRIFTLHRRDSWEVSLASQGFGSIRTANNAGASKTKVRRSQEWITSVAVSP